ncbi:MAG: LPS export ABC transporter ATP-binding protein [Planctomycetota bacterium]
MLKVEGINKYFSHKQVLNNITVEFGGNRVFGILGPNGAGKSTLFKIIIGILKPTTGKVIFQDREVTNFSIWERIRLGIGYLPQEIAVFRDLSVYENLYCVWEVWKNGMPESILDETLELFGINHVRDVKASKLSGGEARKLELARIHLMKSKLMLLDEPFAGIDPVSVITLKQLITNLKNTSCIILTDHNIYEAIQVVDYCFIIYDGKIIAEGERNHILDNEFVKKIYLGENIFWEYLKNV